LRSLDAGNLRRQNGPISSVGKFDPAPLARITVDGSAMRVDCATEARHIEIDGQRTTIAMERPFWQKTEAIAATRGVDWLDVTADLLRGKPATVGRAKWLRVAILCADER
jgi:predicted DNA-binding ribbon-helix-helix protein